MKKFIILPVALFLLFAGTTMADYWSKKEVHEKSGDNPELTEEDSDSVELEEAVYDVTPEVSSNPTVDEVYNTSQELPYDTIYQRGSVMVYTDFIIGSIALDSFLSLHEPVYFFTLRDGKPVDYLLLNSGLQWKYTDEALYVDMGVDTLRFPWDNLPHSLTEVPVAGYKYYQHRFFYRNLKEAYWSHDELLALLPEAHPAWLDYFIHLFYSRDSYKTNMVNDYLQNLKKGRIDFSAEKLMEEHKANAKEFCDSFLVDYSDPYFWSYTFDLLVHPVWKSADGRWVTYRFSDRFTAGLGHGEYGDYYFTFDSRTGRLLKLEDLFTEKGWKSSLAYIAQRLNEMNLKYAEDTIRVSQEPVDWTFAGIEDDGFGQHGMQDKFKGMYFPYPALMRDGILFNYQVYDKGCFAQGLMSVLLPYREAQMKIKVR